METVKCQIHSSNPVVTIIDNNVTITKEYYGYIPEYDKAFTLAKVKVAEMSLEDYKALLEKQETILEKFDEWNEVKL